MGRGQPFVIPGGVIKPFVMAIVSDYNLDEVDSVGLLDYPISQGGVHAMVQLSALVPYLSVSNIHTIAKRHNIKLGSNRTKTELLHCFEHHDCLSCNLFTSVFKVIPIRHVKHKEQEQQHRSQKRKKALQQSSDMFMIPQKEQSQEQVFPPKPLNSELSHQIISGFCEGSTTDCLE